MNKLSRKSNKIPSKVFLHFIEPQIKLEGFEFYDVSKLDKIKDSYFDEVIIQDLLEHFSDAESIPILRKIISKTKQDGKIHIQGTDANALCCGVAYSQIDIVTFKTLLFGANKINIFNLAQLKKQIQDNIKDIDLNKIKFINGLQYYIECIKK